MGIEISQEYPSWPIVIFTIFTWPRTHTRPFPLQSKFIQSILPRIPQLTRNTTKSVRKQRSGNIGYETYTLLHKRVSTQNVRKIYEVYMLMTNSSRCFFQFVPNNANPISVSIPRLHKSLSRIFLNLFMRAKHVSEKWERKGNRVFQTDPFTNRVW